VLKVKGKAQGLPFFLVALETQRLVFLETLSRLNIGAVVG